MMEIQCVPPKKILFLERCFFFGGGGGLGVALLFVWDGRIVYLKEMLVLEF